MVISSLVACNIYNTVVHQIPVSIWSSNIYCHADCFKTIFKDGRYESHPIVLPIRIVYQYSRCYYDISLIPASQIVFKLVPGHMLAKPQKE
uniref:Uncharacterized protein n=1 Tax=Arion vulgaris TaxID=1028688 RepID=A0A0B6ZCC9_9EUPU